ncbi:hypothetical protein [Janthinobacterium sp. RB2P8]|uniref:hypothetical protein n=1 Tax=Janthinobacterium sp. RB2P8 TaxID=3424191 RepID=UPI003F2903FF
MMNDFLFADFLEDHAAYAAAQAYWQARMAFLDGQCTLYLCARRLPTVSHLMTAIPSSTWPTGALARRRASCSNARMNSAPATPVSSTPSNWPPAMSADRRRKRSSC